MKTSIQLAVLPLLALLVVVVGCAKPSNRSASLSGKVTYKGAPVTGGSMTLHIGEANYPVAISTDGSYSANQLPEGEAIVTVNTDALNPAKPTYGGKDKGGMSPIPEGASKAAGVYVKIPEKYKSKEKSDVKVTLKAGRQTQDIPLTD